jgi:hypothetical protein
MLTGPQVPTREPATRSCQVVRYHRYHFEHELTAPDRDEPLFLAWEQVRGTQLAMCWLLSRVYGIAARLLDPAAAAPLAESTAAVYAEAVAALERGYGLNIATDDGTHTVRVLRERAVDQDQAHGQEPRT